MLRCRVLLERRRTRPPRQLDSERRILVHHVDAKVRATLPEHHVKLVQSLIGPTFDTRDRVVDLNVVSPGCMEHRLGQVARRTVIVVHLEVPTMSTPAGDAHDVREQAGVLGVAPMTLRRELGAEVPVCAHGDPVGVAHRDGVQQPTAHVVLHIHVSVAHLDQSLHRGEVALVPGIGVRCEWLESRLNSDRDERGRA